MKKINKILIIIQRSNGDVFLSSSLIQVLYEFYKSPQIDLLVNDDTLPIAKTLPFINKIITFSYKKKHNSSFMQEGKIISSIFKKYNLSINLTASDRSVLYAIFSARKSISAVEINHRKSWWKKKLLSSYYFFDSSRHILLNNLEPLNLLNIKHDDKQGLIKSSQQAKSSVSKILEEKGIKNFIIFHPSSQYEYKIYPRHLRDQFLRLLNSLEIPIVITGSNNQIDLSIKNDLPDLKNIYDLIGITSIDEYLALSELAFAYIGMDTLNTHIAAMQKKRIFAIFGPTNLKMWSPWSNKLRTGAQENRPIQTYDQITIFQSNLPCVACGKAGCNDLGRSECLYDINPAIIFNEVKDWFINYGV